MVNRLKLSSFGHFRPKDLNFGKLKHCQTWIFHSFNRVLVIGSLLLLFLVAIGSGYFYNTNSFPQPIVLENAGDNRTNTNFSGECNLFVGNWVPDESYPLYNASECPFAEQGFSCLGNGRKDKEYLKWRWKPRNCEIPRFDVHVILKNLRGKRIVFVGDSLSRTQWESMICILMTGVEDKNSVYEVKGRKITRQIRHLQVRFSSFNFTVEFYRSIFLVQPGSPPKRSPKRIKKALMLDKLDDINKEWIDSDILIFNTGHWWTPTKLFELGWYFQIDGKMKLGMTINGAFNKALTTWQSWIENKINSDRTRVFFRTFEATHWSAGPREKCNVTRQPWSDTNGKDKSAFSDMIIDTVKNAAIPVTLLHVTPMGAYRSDAHVGNWSDNPSVPDCSHYCLPGVPDMWNELLFAFLFSEQQYQIH
uniref:Protein trichome berefringence-like 7 n=1 Tax=Nicotiana tabacum TaxID=4097 RepID=A0A1S3YHZ2_TOBAC|nr:PREDICTED: protein trichome berefringence-like 7 [Nicotiana tabacum]